MKNVAAELIGQKFNRLTVIKRAGSKEGKALWKCKCECGNEIFVTTDKLRNGNTKSCGCYFLDRITKHGLNGSKLYKTWANMIERCSCVSASHYINYGGRGIKVCDEWKNFENFSKWAFDNGYVEEHKRGEITLDRIDVNGNYEPSNCRWISNKEQQNNKTGNRIIVCMGQSHTLSEWSEIRGIHKRTLKARLDKGWPVERALYQPVKKSRG